MRKGSQLDRRIPIFYDFPLVRTTCRFLNSTSRQSVGKVFQRQPGEIVATYSATLWCIVISLMIIVMITVMIMTFMIMIMMILMIMITIMKPESYHTGEYPGGEPCSTSLSDCSPSCISSGCDYHDDHDQDYHDDVDDHKVTYLIFVIFGTPP